MSKKQKPTLWQQALGRDRNGKKQSYPLSIDDYDSDHSDWNNMVQDRLVGKLDTKQISPNRCRTLDDIRALASYPGTYGYMRHGRKKVKGGFEVEWLQEGEQNHLEKENWKYFINDYGFRGKFNTRKLKKHSLGVFGCSMTFGEGVQEEDTWGMRLAKQFNYNLYNFGIGGAGPIRTARTFASVSNVFKLKYAIVMLPQSSRIEGYDFTDKDEFGESIPTRIRPINIIPQFPPSGFEELYTNYYKVMSDQACIAQALLACDYISQTAKANGTNVVFCTWDTLTLWAMHNGQVSQLYNKLFKRIDLGRDDNHPGILSHKRFAESLGKYINDNSWF
tara:strand:+ start:67 stop:1068 length:1002 start_codon:yes stop_codon:yes gene_type:complete